MPVLFPGNWSNTSLDPVALSLTGTPITQNNSTEVSRTISSLFLKTFTLRTAVMTAYGHLGTLQGQSENWRTALLRMIILFVLPGATLVGDFFPDYCYTLFCFLMKRNWSWRWLLLSAAGYNIETQLKTVNSDSITTGVFNIGVLPFDSLRYTPLPWSWDKLLLHSGRFINLTIVLAQAIASLVLRIDTELLASRDVGCCSLPPECSSSF